MKNKITSHFEFLLLFDRVNTYSISVQYMHNYGWCIWEGTLTQSTLTQSTLTKSTLTKSTLTKSTLTQSTLTQSPRGSVSGGGMAI